MENNLIVIDPKAYGLEQTKADLIAESFREPLAEMAELETEYKNFENLTGEPPETTCAEAKELKQRYGEIRRRTADIHKAEKAYFLNAGRYVDAWKNRQKEIGDQRETKLSEIADYYVNIEKARIAELTTARETAIRACAINDEMYIPPKLGEMPDEVWNTYFEGVQKKYDEYQAEQKRILEEKEAEEKSQREEQERIRLENEQLKKEAEAREKQLAKERAEQEKKLAAERAEQEAKLATERAEREKLETEKREREEAERKAAEAKEEDERRQAAAPDKNKINLFLVQLESIVCPELSTNGARRIIDKARTAIDDLAATIREEMDAL